MRPSLDKRTFGPWAVVTGSSSGIGRAIARHLGSSGINVVLVARREAQLESVGHELFREFSVDYWVVRQTWPNPASFSTSSKRRATSTSALPSATLVSLARASFLTIVRDELLRAVRVKVDANLTLVHHFGQRLAARGRGASSWCRPSARWQVSRTSPTPREWRRTS
jgi:uncharacterized protein